MKGMGRQGPWPGGYVHGRPSEIFRRHVFVSPHHYGEDIGELIDLLGASQVLFGSDFPHAEGMSDVEDYQERTAELVARRRPSRRRDPHDHARQRAAAARPRPDPYADSSAGDDSDSRDLIAILSGLPLPNHGTSASDQISIRVGTL